MRAANFYAAPGFERAALRRRDPTWIREALALSSSHFIPVWRNQNLVFEIDGGAPAAAAIPCPGLLSAIADPEEALGCGEVVFLGIVEERAHFALDLSRFETPLEALKPPALGAAGVEAEKLAFTDLRRVGALLERRQGALLAFARAMLFWHSRHRFCGVCGSPTRSEEAGHVRRCTGCDTLHFPRTDPAVIMLVSHGEEVLLAHQAHFPRGMYSTLAGFVEPGESLEDAVAREVFEEAGIEVASVRYHSSQPWPFPANIMLGFHAEARTRELTLDKDELEDARWFARDWLKAHPDDDRFRLPRRDSIARRLVEDWLAGRIES
jgi:NAD+ diphosphatase